MYNEDFTSERVIYSKVEKPGAGCGSIILRAGNNGRTAAPFAKALNQKAGRKRFAFYRDFCLSRLN